RRIGRDADGERLALPLPHDRRLQRLAGLEARENAQRVLRALRHAAGEVDDDVAVAEAEIGRAARAYDEQAFVDAEIFAERRRQRHELDVAPGAGRAERRPARDRPRAVVAGEYEGLPQRGLTRLHDDLAIIATAQKP